MNWAAMTSSELLSYAPLHATTDLERHLLGQLEQATESLADAERQLDDASDDVDTISSLESKLEELKDELFAILNDEEGGEAELLKRVREVLDGA